MTDKEEESWVKAVSTMVYFYLVEKTKRRVSDGELHGLRFGQAPERPSQDFQKSWQSIAADLYYRLRSARTKRLFADCFTQTLCSIPQGKLNKHLDTIAGMMRDDREWEELRDVTMLALSAKAYRRETQPTEG